MYENLIFSIVLLSQVLLISFVLPRKVLERVRHVVKNYPPDQYPRLYPVGLEESERARRMYRNANGVMFLLGLALVGYTLYAPGGEMSGLRRNVMLLGLRPSMMVFLYFMLQFSPMIIAATSGFTYFNLKRSPDTRSRRSADLRRRRLTDYVSPGLLAAVGFVYVSFVAFVAYIDTFDFPWFGGYYNVLGMTIMNLFFVGIVAKSIYGKRKDPYQSAADRDRLIEITVGALAAISIAGTLFVTLSIVLGALELRHLAPIAQSIYFQVIAAFSFRSLSIEDINFEVYRDDAVTT